MKTAKLKSIIHLKSMPTTDDPRANINSPRKVVTGYRASPVRKSTTKIIDTIRSIRNSGGSFTDSVNMVQGVQGSGSQ